MFKPQFKLESYDELISSEQDIISGTDERLFSDTNIIEVPLTAMHSFKNHPICVREDEELDDLCESILKNGILHPAS